MFAGTFTAGGLEVHIEDGRVRIATEGRQRKFVKAVQQVTFSGAHAARKGQQVLYVTERCVMRLTDAGLVATEIMPGIDPQAHIVEASQGRVRVAADAITMPAALFGTGPMGWQP